MSHPDKNGVPTIDLSKDHEADADVSGLTDTQAAIERVIKKVFSHYSIPLEISGTVRNTFKCKLWRMGKTLSSLGGTKCKQTLSNWKEGKLSIWSFTVNTKEAQRQLLKRSHQVEVQLEREKVKRQKLEAEAKNTKCEIKSLKKNQVEQARTIANLRAGRLESYRSSTSRDWQSYSKQHQAVKRKRLASEIQSSLSFCEETAFVPKSVSLVNKDTGDQEVLDLTSGSFSSAVGNSGDLEREDKAKFALYVKDKFSLSHQAYHELTLLSGDLPRSYNIKKLTKELNSKYNISPLPGDLIGVQQKLKDRLLVHLPSSCMQGETVRLKLSGDGTAIGRNLHVINFTFTLLDSGGATSVAGNHSLAIMKVPEKYDELHSGLQDIVSEASDLQVLVVGGQTLTLQYFLGGDWKFLALVCGLDAANSTYSCIWCKFPASERWNMDLEWSITDTAKGARTIEEITRLAQKPKSTERFNCSHSPVFSFIPMHYVVIDSLHLFLRVCDLLINLLIQELRRQDGIEKSSSVKLDRTKQTHLATYERFLNQQCKISFCWYVDDSNRGT